MYISNKDGEVEMLRYRGWFVNIAKAIRLGIRFWEEGYEVWITNHEYGGYSLYTRLRI
jgi:hypothetical protein